MQQGAQFLFAQTIIHFTFVVAFNPVAMEPITIYPPDKCVDLFSSMLTITGVHKTMDMSVANVTRKEVYLLGDELEGSIGSEIVTVPCCGEVKVLKLAENGVKMLYSGKEYFIGLGEKVQTQSYLLENKYLSSEEIWIEFEYITVDMYELALSLFTSLSNHYAKFGSSSPKSLTSERQLLLSAIKGMIDRGEVSCFPLYVLLSSTQNWNVPIISDYSIFKSLFEEFLSDGSTQKDNSGRWLDYMKQICLYNDVNLILKQVPLLEFYLRNASEQGYESANELLFRKVTPLNIGPRQNPDLEEYLLTIKCYDTKNEACPEYLWRVFPLNSLTAGDKIYLENWGNVTIEEISDESVTPSWRGCSTEVQNDYIIRSIDSSSPTSMDYPFGYRATNYISFELCKRNLWAHAKTLIEGVCFSLRFDTTTSSAELAQQKYCALRLLEILIDRGDASIKNVYDFLQVDENWRELDVD